MIKKFSPVFLLIFSIVLLMIIFESSQQLYYVKRFQPEFNVTFFELASNQTLKWLVWLALGVFLKHQIKKLALRENLVLIDCFKLFFLILVLIFLGIIITGLLSYFYNNVSSPFIPFIKESILFLVVQKTPIYTIAYIGFSVVMYFYYLNQKLKVEIIEFGKLRLENQSLYKKIKNNYIDQVSILKIKVGHNYKIIPIKEIDCIKANDYCVDIYSQDAQVYTLRKSLKALEKILPENFLRVHRSTIVNMEKTRSLELKNNTRLVLKNNLEIKVSKSNLSSVKAYLSKNALN